MIAANAVAEQQPIPWYSRIGDAMRAPSAGKAVVLKAVGEHVRYIENSGKNKNSKNQTNSKHSFDGH